MRLVRPLLLTLIASVSTAQPVKTLTEKHFGTKFNKVFSHLDKDEDGDVDLTELRRLMFGNFLVPGADPMTYQEVTQYDALKNVVAEYLDDFNASSKKPMHLVLFLFALEHVCRIARVLSQPGGHALPVGVGGLPIPHRGPIRRRAVSPHIIAARLLHQPLRCWQAGEGRALRRTTDGGVRRVHQVLPDGPAAAVAVNAAHRPPHNLCMLNRRVGRWVLVQRSRDEGMERRDVAVRLGQCVGIHQPVHSIGTRGGDGGWSARHILAVLVLVN